MAATGGGSGNPIVYSSSGDCTRSGATFTITSASGTCTVGYDQVGNSKYSEASGVVEKVDGVAAFGGFQAPAPNTPVPYNPDMSVRLALTDVSGKALTPAEAAPLAAAGDVEVVLTGPNGNRTQLASAPCTRNKSQFFFCTLSLPPGLATGPNNQYSLSAFQRVGSGGRVLLPPYTGAPAADANPETILFG